jgi:hypothetical protein
MFLALKNLGLLGIMLFTAMLVITLLGPYFGPNLGAWWKEPSDRFRTTINIWAISGMLLLFIDACRRNFTCKPAIPLAFALLGPLTLGISSIAYYFIWGIGPLLPAEAIYGTEFCPLCLSNSYPQSAPKREYHFPFGAVLLGHGERCATCKSYLQTYWLVYFIPLIPTSSYRVVPLAPGVAITRKTPLAKKQVMFMYALGTAPGIPILIWMIRHHWWL